MATRLGTRIERIGALALPDGRVYSTDPCVLPLAIEVVVLEMLPGRYAVFAQVDRIAYRDGTVEERPAVIWISHEDEHGFPVADPEPAALVHVDSATAGFVPAGCLEPLRRVRNRRIDGLSTSHTGIQKIPGRGSFAWSLAGEGDGTYPSFLFRRDDGTAVRASIMFYPDDITSIDADYDEFPG